MLKNTRLVSVLLSITILLSCNDKPKETRDAPVEKKTETTVKKTKITEPVKQITTDFGGIWVNKKYVDKLLSTKSPKKSQDVVPITMMVLPKVINKEATIIYGFHEGAKGKVVKSKEGYEIQSNESEEPAQPFKLENNRIKTKKDEFIRIKDYSEKNNYKIAEQLLFVGKYDLDGKTIEFTADGKVKGLDNFSYYSVLIDYYDSGMQVDQLRLGKSFDNSKLYGFDFKRDHLIIYDLKCAKKSENGLCEVVKFGKKLYKLRKK